MQRYTPRAGRRAARILLGLAALTAMLALVVAVPLVLLVAWRYLGPPLPSPHELASPDDGTLFVRTLCLVGWAGWVTFTWSVLTEILAQWRGWRLPALGFQQRVAAVLLTAIAMMLASPAIVSATASPVHAAAAVTAPAHGTPPSAAVSEAGANTAVAAAAAGYIEHPVQPGEQMPALAERYLGDKYQWHVIAAATYGISQPDGRVLRHGDTRVYPGWTVRIPAAAAARATAVAPAAYTTTSTPAAAMVYQARHGDWVWYIAERFLGDPQRYPEIAALNPDLAHKYGGTFPDHIEPGDTLRLPADAHDRGPRPHSTGTVATPAPPASTNPPGTDTTPGGAAPGDAQPTPPAAPAPSPSTTVPSSPTPATTISPTPTALADPTPDPASTGGQIGPVVPSAPATVAPSVGVAASPIPTPTQAPSPTPSASHTAPNPTVTASPHGTSTNTGVDLGDRGWVTVEVATAVAAAAVLLWIQRRRRYRPQPVNARRRDTDLTALPRTIAALHRARTPAEDDDMEELLPDQPEAATVTTASFGMHTNHTPLRLPDLPSRGVGLTGDGAAPAGRGILAAVLSAGGPWAPHAEASIITTRADLAHLLPDVDVEPLASDRLHVADTLDDALGELERDLLRRARLATIDGDVTSDPTDDPDLAMPPSVFLTAAPTGSHATRLAAILAVGSRLAIAAVLTGDWPHGDTWNVNTDGTTTDRANSAGPRLNILDPAATIDILDTLRQARPDTDDLPPAPAPLRPATLNPASRPDATAGPAEAAANGAVAAHSRVSAPAPAATRPADARRLQLAVLGRPTVQVVTPDSHTGLRIRRKDGMQILVNLAVNPHGATSDELMAVLWPEVRPTFSRGRFHTTMHELRQHLDESVNAEAIPRTGERYHLDPDHVHVDLWQLNTAIEQAATALDPAAHDAALHQIIDLYHGTIAEGHSWLWLAPHREEIRRHILDTYVALADTAPDPQTALAHIQDAIRLDPYNEDVYQRAMTLHAKLGSLDGVRRTLRALSERLAELEVRVSPQTQKTASDLVNLLDARHRVTGTAA